MLDARSRLTPLLGTAMAGVAAGCLLLFAVFARQAILDVNAGLGVLPRGPVTAAQAAITLLSPLQTTGTSSVEEGVPTAPAAAPPAAAASPGIVVVTPPTDDFAGPPGDGRDDAGRGELGDLPLGERLPTGLARQDSDRWFDAREKARENQSKARDNARENRSQAREKARENQSKARENARQNRSQARENRSQDCENRSQARENQSKARENQSKARENQSNRRGKGHRGRGKGHRGPPKGRGRH